MTSRRTARRRRQKVQRWLRRPHGHPAHGQVPAAVPGVVVGHGCLRAVVVRKRRTSKPEQNPRDIKELDRKIAALREVGLTYREISVKLKVSEARVTDAVRRTRPRDPTQDAEVVRLFNLGYNRCDIAHDMGLSHQRVTYLVQQAINAGLITNRPVRTGPPPPFALVTWRQEAMATPRYFQTRQAALAAAPTDRPWSVVNIRRTASTPSVDEVLRSRPAMSNPYPDYRSKAGE